MKLVARREHSESLLSLCRSRSRIARSETNLLFICSIIDDGNSRCTDVDRASKGIGSMCLPVDDANYNALK